MNVSWASINILDKQQQLPEIVSDIRLSRRTAGSKSRWNGLISLPASWKQHKSRHALIHRSDNVDDPTVILLCLGIWFIVEALVAKKKCRAKVAGYASNTEIVRSSRNVPLRAMTGISFTNVESLLARFKYELGLLSVFLSSLSLNGQASK